MSEQRRRGGAAMSGFVFFLLSVTVVQGWLVTYSPRTICALKGSTVQMHSSYSYPSHQNDVKLTVEKRFWFTEMKDDEPVDLTADTEFAGRVQHKCNGQSCTLTISDLRESDAALYKFRFTTNHKVGKYTGDPGVTLSFTAFQVKMYTYRGLTCHSSCSLPGDHSFIWYKNGQKVTGRTFKSYYTGTRNSADSYSCTVRGHEDIASPSVCLSGILCNKVTYADRNICAPKGSSVNISCTYNSYGPDIQSAFWFSSNQTRPEDLRGDTQYAGRVQSSEGRSTLRISELTESDSAEYHFKFRTKDFEWRNDLPGTTLTVTALQVQVSRSSDHQSSTSAELKCLTRCRPAVRLSFVWLKNGQKMEERTSSYRAYFSPEDRVSCAIEGHESSHSASVYAPKRPSVSVSPSGDIMEGSSVNLTCSSDANPAANHTWYKEDEDVKPLSEDPQLSFRSISSSDSGTFYCRAENELGRIRSDPVSVNVEYAPKIPSVSVSPSGDIMEGSSVNLTCSSDANPAATYTWFKKDEDSDMKPLSEDPQLSFRSIRSSDSGTFHCRAENKLERIRSDPVSVNVEYAPKLPSVSVSPSGDIMEGSSVNLTCSSDANPAANHTWYKEDEDSPKASGQTYTITDVTPEHSGNYYCEAQNSRGRHNSTLRLTVVAAAWKSTVAGTVCAVLLAASLLLSVLLWIRRKKSSKPPSEASGGGGTRTQASTAPDNASAAKQREDLLYASVFFSKNQADPLYSNIRPFQPHRHQEEEDVEYTEVKFNGGRTTPRGQDADEDSSALYSAINKKRQT